MAEKMTFRGTFDGANFTINRLHIAGGGNTGMFSWAINADFKNIRLTNVKVTGGGNTGAIAGYVRNVDLKDSYVSAGTVTGTVQGESSLGMVFGSAGDFVRISRCYATGTVNGWGKYVGGLIGARLGFRHLRRSRDLGPEFQHRIHHLDQYSQSQRPAQVNSRP